ncbi:MAG: S-adenosylmethionine:tRNA ribosyltransferase-isomerase, partial [Clostridiales Family XIII bacterium]|nr:S-adenosylmethionine:tRNA ribosyltransferase-isomerase [Clostridiales Family XIII bacterium]
MNIDLFDYHLPPERIAQYPAGKRDESRLLVVKRRENRTEHRRFFDIVDYIEAGDVLVVNDSKVVHARLIGRKASTGATVELFLVGRVDLSKDRGAGGESVSRDGEDARIFPIDDATRDLDGTADFEVLAKPAKRLKLGDVVRFGDGLEAEILLEKDDGGRVARFRWTGSFRERIEELGNIPLPPYIKRPADDEDVRRY